jgi:hypothetical protein
MSENITVLVFPVGKSPQIENIERGLKPMQTLVGGLIQFVPLVSAHGGPVRGCEGLEACCNEEGLLEGLPANRMLPWGDALVGNFFVTKTDPETGESASLTVADIEAAKKYFKGRELEPIPVEV